MKKGFTLIELLSVIIIIAVITLIAVPIVSGVITKVKLGSLKSSANGLLEASDLYYARYSNTSSLRFDIDNNIVSSNDTTNLLTYNGTVKEGTVIINKKGEVTLCITDGTNSVYKNYRDKKVVEAANKKCNIPSSTYVVYLDNTATLSELSNEELTEIVRQLQEEVAKKADQDDLDETNQNLEIVSTIAGSSTIDKIYPVGSIYASSNSTSPATLFGGTWERIKDSFLLSSGDTYTVGSTGGNANTTLVVDNLPSHSHGLNSHTHAYYKSATSTENTALTINQIPSHNHKFWTNPSAGLGAGSYEGLAYTMQSALTTDGRYGYTSSQGGSQGHNHSITLTSTNTGPATGNTTVTGSGTSFSNMPPYTVVYMWKRTA